MVVNNNQESITNDERHWDQVCLTILTIGTATLAAVLIVWGLDLGKNDQDGFLAILTATTTAAAGGLYLIMALRTIYTILTPTNVTKNNVREWKRNAAHSVLVTFGTLVITLAATLFITLIDKTDFQWTTESTPMPELITSDNLIAFEIPDQPAPTADTIPNLHLSIYTTNQDSQDPEPEWILTSTVTADQLAEALRTQGLLPWKNRETTSP